MPYSKILVVDDEPDLEVLVKQKFRKEIKENQYDFTFAGNGIQALEKLNKDRNIELILADINMPEMDGLTLLAKIKELNNPLLHSVIVSAYGDIKNIRTAMNGGAFDFVIKPIDFTDLKITIDKAVDNLETLKKALQARDKLVVVQNELEEARQLQLSMLPKDIPQLPYLEVAVYMKTATEVGGDYYDFSGHETGPLNICLGDATGHGMKAGIMVSSMKSIFTTNAPKMDIEQFFVTANSGIKSMNLKRMMMGLTMLNVNKSGFKLINAGMPPVFWFHSKTKMIEEIKEHGLPVGAMNQSSYTAMHGSLEEGDVLLLMTDGMPEMQNANAEMYGYERVQQNFMQVAQNGPQQIIDHLKNEAVAWANGHDPDDDVTFVVIKIK